MTFSPRGTGLVATRPLGLVSIGVRKGDVARLRHTAGMDFPVLDRGA